MVNVTDQTISVTEAAERLGITTEEAYELAQREISKARESSR